MKKLMKKKVNVFGKKFPVFVIALFAIGLVSAALLPYFGMITGMAVVSQSVILEDNEVTGEWNTNLVAGESVIDCDDDFNGHWVKNNAGVPVAIQFGTDCWKGGDKDDGTRYSTNIDWSDVNNNKCDGIVTEIYGILELTKKVISTWQPTGIVGDTIEITYTIVGDTFEATGDLPAGYVLVYAMDKENRFNDYATVIRVEDVDESLPMVGDWNANANPDYCDKHNTFDDFEHCVGAKIWAVPEIAIGVISEDGVSYKLTWADMANYYYETDLIVYSDNTNNEITLPANGGGFNFCVKQDFALNLVADTYTIETKILPVTA